MATTMQSSDFARIHDNVKYLQSHFLNYKAYHATSSVIRNSECKYCGVSTCDPTEICEVETINTQERAHKNIEGAEILISKLSDMTEVEREKVLGFLNQCLHHHHM